MSVTTRRPPHLQLSKLPGREHYAVVICSGTKKNGRRCSRALGEVNIAAPVDVQFRCHDCRSVYELKGKRS